MPVGTPATNLFVHWAGTRDHVGTGAVLQRSSEALDGIPYVHTGSAALHLTWCVSLQIDHGPEHFVFPSTLSPQDVARGYPRCRVIFAFPFLRGRPGKLTRCRPLAGSTVESFGKTAVSLSSNVLASCSPPACLLASGPSVQRLFVVHIRG